MRTKDLLKRTMPYYKKYWKTMVFDLFCAGLTTICELVLPLIIKYFTNTAIEDASSLTVKIVLMLVLVVLRILLTWHPFASEQEFLHRQ